MIRQLLSSLTITSITVLLLTGCGSAGNEAVKAAGNTTNSFAQNPDTAGNEIKENGTSDTTSCSGTPTSGVTYCLAVEATDSMIASWQSELFDLITPSKAYAFRGLMTVQAKSIKIIQVDQNLNEISPSVVPTYTVKENTTLGNYSITFDSAPPSRFDIVAKITLNNDEILYSPFIESSVDDQFKPIIIVNVVSDFLVKQLFNRLNSEEDLNRLLPCEGGGSGFGNNVGCKSQPFAKYSLWGGLNGIVQSYEIDIPSSHSISQALELLNNTGDFKSHIETGLNEILRAEEVFVGGTERELLPVTENPENSLENLSTSASYNSSLFTLAFNQIKPDTGTSNSSISTAISAVSTETVGEVSVKNYPYMLRNTSNIQVSLTGFIGDIPFNRTSLLLTENNEVSISPTLTNSLSSAASNTFLTTQGFYVAGRVPYQTITEKTDTTGVGWQFDPYSYLIYSPDADNGTPNSLISSFVSNGSSYAITTDGSSTWSRQSKLEEQNMFSWAVHNQMPTDEDGKVITIPSDGFKTENIEGKSYGAISFSVKLSDAGAIQTTTGKLLSWNATSNTEIAENQPDVIPGSGESHYKTYSFSRDSSGTLSVAPVSENSSSVTRSYNVDLTTQSSKEGLVDISLGRLTISAPDISEESDASSTPNGEMVTVTLNETGAGQGLIQAMELRTTTPDITAGLVYRLAGNSFGANSSHNILRNYGNSSITFTDPSRAVLTLNIIESKHNTSTREVTKLTPLAEISNIEGSYVVENGLIQFTFPNIEEETLTFKGFMSKTDDNSPGNVITLLMIHGYDSGTATIGLVHGFKELTLPPEGPIL